MALPKHRIETFFCLLQNSFDFPGGFSVSALDNDENGTQNAEVR